FTDQQPVIETVMVVFAWTIAGPTVSSFVYICDGIFICATETPPMRISIIIAKQVVFLTAYYIVTFYLFIHSIWLAMTLFMLASGATLTVYATRYIFKTRG